MMTKSVNIIVSAAYRNTFLHFSDGKLLSRCSFLSEVNKKVSLLSAKHLRPVNSRGEPINKGMKFVDIFAW